MLDTAPSPLVALLRHLVCKRLPSSSEYNSGSLGGPDEPLKDWWRGGGAAPITCRHAATLIT